MTELSDWMNVIRKQGEQAQKEQEEKEQELAKIVESFSPSSYSNFELVELLRQNSKRNSIFPVEQRLWREAEQKIADEILRRLEK